MAIGRISGPLLKQNLLREGVNLAFENDLLYLDVQQSKVGIKNASPQYELDVTGKTRTTTLNVSSTANLGDIVINAAGSGTTQDTMVLGTTTGNSVVYQNKLRVDSLELQNNVIRTINSNENLELTPNGTGTVEIFADTNVYGNITATGSITADGNITIGDADTDNITFNAELASNIIPDIDNTYSLGSNPDVAGGKEWSNVYTDEFYGTTVTTTNLNVDGIDLSTRQGNLYYVSENGDDTNSGDHPNDPYGSLRYALSQATSGDTIHIYPGVYQEITPLTVPVGVTVKGHSMRSVILEPTGAAHTNDIFLLNG